MNIFLDTSVFEKANFLKGNEIKQILFLSEIGHVNILMPVITYKEIINRAEKNIIEYLNKLNSFQNSGKIFKNFPEMSSIFNKYDDRVLIENFVESLDYELYRSKVNILDYPNSDVGKIFEKYFNKLYPFSVQKKDEFPDAFALHTIEVWCANNKSKCIVFSLDSDMLRYSSDYLTLNNDLKSFISGILKEIESKNERNSRLSRLDILFELERENIGKGILNFINTEINLAPNIFLDSSTYIESVEILQSYVKLGDYKIVSITDSSIALESTVYVHLEVTYYTEDTDSWSYENIDSDLLRNNSREESEINLVLLSQFTAHIPVSGESSDVSIVLNEIDINNMSTR